MRHRLLRHVLRAAVLVGALAAAGIGAVAGLSLYSTTTASQEGAVTAATIGAATQPSVSVSGRDVALSWLSAANASAYTVSRASTQGLDTTEKGTCAGAVTATACTDTGLPQSAGAATTWTYTVTPTFNSWQGATGPASALVTIPAPTLTLGSTTFTADGGTTTASVRSFFDGEGVTLCLDRSTGCTGSSILGTTTVPASGGAASTTLTLPAGVSAGAHTVYAIGSLGSAPSVAITVTPGSAKALVFTTQPVAGVPLGTTFSVSPVVTVQDAAGNTVTSDTGTITLAIASGPGAGSLSCSNAGFPNVTAVAGVARFFNCRISGSASAAGTYTLSATRSGLTSTGPSSSLTVTNTTANKLVFTRQPVGTVAEGVAFSTMPQVKVEDTNNNVIGTDSGPVTLQIASGPAGGVLSCTNSGFPTVNASAGVVSFTGCKITGTAAAGTYTLVATRPGLTPTAASSNIVIRVGSASQLAFTTQPVANVAENVAFATSPVVKVQDAYGNVVTTDSGTVTLAIASGPASGALSCTTTGFPTITASSGVATFSGCKITGTAAAGAYTLTTTRSGLTAGTSSSLTVTPGAATRLAFTTQPVGGVPEGTGLATSPVVSVLDAYGNAVTSDSGTVTLSIASGPAAGVLSCANAGFPAVGAVAGVAAFVGCQITGAAAAGSYTLAATRSGLTGTGASSSVVVTVGSATQLVFSTQPLGPALLGAPFTTSPAVAVADAYGNTVTSDTGSITLAIASGPDAGVLSCTSAGFPTVSAVAGIATFAGCQIGGNGGTFTLAASRPGLTPAASASIVVAAPAVHVSGLTGVAANKDGSSWNATVTVTVVDQFGVPAAGVAVTGTWSPLAASPSGCTTASSGQCAVATAAAAFPLSQASETWTVAALSKAGYAYASSANVQGSVTLFHP